VDEAWMKRAMAENMARIAPPEAAKEDPVVGSITNKDGKTLVQLWGTLGKDPEPKETSAGTVVELSLAIPTGFDREDPTNWYDVSVWDEVLQQQLLARNSPIRRGVRVAVSGWLTFRMGSNGKEYPKVKAFSLGLIDWLERSAPGQARRPAAPATAPAQREEGFPF
jgi:hypothetical protein